MTGVSHPIILKIKLIHKILKLSLERDLFYYLSMWFTTSFMWLSPFTIPRYSSCYLNVGDLVDRPLSKISQPTFPHANYLWGEVVKPYMSLQNPSYTRSLAGMEKTRTHENSRIKPVTNTSSMSYWVSMDKINGYLLCVKSRVQIWIWLYSYPWLSLFANDY